MGGSACLLKTRLLAMNIPNYNDLQASLHRDLKFEDQGLCEQINKTFITAMENYTPLSSNIKVSFEDDSPVEVTEFIIAKKLREIRIYSAGGPHNLPNWVLKHYSDILAEPVPNIINLHFENAEFHLFGNWQTLLLFRDFSKDLRRISL